jgi:hypothetical protein
MSPTGENAASMSVVLATHGGREGIARVLGALCEQSRSGDLELVIVAEASASDPILREDEAARFASHQVVRIAELSSKAVANAAGARSASAAIVVFAEDHCFADPGWAEAMLRRFEDVDVVAVGPRVRNANPATALSWCDLVVNYGSWMSASAGGPRSMLPGLNTAYRRSALLHYDDRLEAWLEVENEMHLDMQQRGLTLSCEPGAVVAHVNLSRWASWLPALFYAGRLYAAERARSWSAARRAVYTLGSPAIPFMRWVRLLLDWPRDVQGLPSRWRLAPALLGGLVADAAGQALGFARGAGQASQRMLPFEFARAPHLRPEERSLVEAAP